ncbi:MAG: beta-hydroxyacyl-ACP dehydratase [Lentisphaerae bacterium]|jgi:3-hydroxyacyl-[acyl-carrier-protein] dehydratase|nr:beta-hydroxyacyl-ACP dehydratase [Lentisphaerota bacterium]MBT4815727.1 beta-hydroxyacyl-ACP dehydratase [Lentisphaerota bacterium]MBT5609999.1 beta-hydroxyacyl-ACP dehydratase [Lentisphaerota bacterium]MBT7059122.1 beta-hydroxyacyl-ACP dehydratase [Lentisphaerota bacterium]MBT7841444.1 beta-hydroxyacyl-ACP dehydratase [Lentisphaerota bacterium]
MSAMTTNEILELIPQQHPFRFIDNILEIDEETIVSEYTYRLDETFYAGHFPGNPITPGVILLETIAQTAVVAHGIFLASLMMPKEEILQTLTVFTDARVKFKGMVKPGDHVTIRSTKTAFRHLRMKADATMFLDDGSVCCKASVAGIGVKQA